MADQEYSAKSNMTDIVDSEIGDDLTDRGEGRQMRKSFRSTASWNPVRSLSKPLQHILDLVKGMIG
jgi:hypothetical protein